MLLVYRGDIASIAVTSTITGTDPASKFANFDAFNYDGKFNEEGKLVTGKAALTFATFANHYRIFYYKTNAGNDIVTGEKVKFALTKGTGAEVVLA